MSKFLKAASFEPCPNCGCHGQINFSDGSNSSEIRSKEQALTVIEQAVKDGKLIDLEAKVVIEQINESDMMDSEISAQAMSLVLFMALGKLGCQTDRDEFLEKIQLN